MRLVSAATAAFVGGTVIAVSGCFGPPPYAYPQPGMYQQPIQTLEPGGTYIPGSGTYAPGTIQSTPPSGGSGSLTPIDGGDAPSYSSSGSGAQSRPVPNPPAAGSTSPFYGSSTSSSSNSTFQDPMPSSQYSPPASSSPMAPMANPPVANPFGNPASGTPAGTQEISFPRTQQAPTMLEVRTGPRLSPEVTVAYGPEFSNDVSASVAAHQVSHIADEQELAFDHDRQEFTWLRGVVSFDETDDSWNIVYSDNPEEADPYAGFLTLVEHPDLESMGDGANVIVHGTVDPVLTDDMGRPVYVVTSVEPVEG